MSMLARALGRFRRRPAKEAADLGFGVVPDPGLANMNWFRQWVGIYQVVDRMARARGGTLVERPLDERMLYIARGLMRYNSYAQGYASALRTHTLGSRGLQHLATGKSARRLQGWLDWWMKEVDWWAWEREIYERVHVEGESVTRFFPGGGCVHLRPVEPEWIVAPDGSQEWTYGFYNEPGDVHDVTALNVLTDGRSEVVDHGEWYHIKSKISVRADKRGRSDFLPVASILDDSFKTWRNFAQSEAVRQAIIYFSEAAEGVTADDLEQALSRQADYSPPSNDGKRGADPMKLTFGAGVEHLPAGTKLNSVPMGSIQSTVSGVNAAMLTVGRQYHMPLVLITGDMGANNTLDFGDESPFGMSIGDEQNWYCRHVRALLWRVVEVAVEEGYVDGDVLHDGTDIEVSAERKPAKDMAQNTQRAKTLAEDGVISKRERSTLEGVDYDEQQEQIKKEAAENPEPPSAPAAQPTQTFESTDPTPSLVEKDVTVHRDGKTFTEKRMVRPNVSTPTSEKKGSRLDQGAVDKVKDVLTEHYGDSKIFDTFGGADIDKLNPNGVDDGKLAVPAMLVNYAYHEDKKAAIVAALEKTIGAKVYLIHTKDAGRAAKAGAERETLLEPPEATEEQWNEFNSKTNDEEKEALKQWTRGKFKEQRKRFVEGKLNGADKALVSALEKAPVHEGVMYRGMNGADLMAGLQAAGVGGTWEDKAPASHTRDPQIAQGFAAGKGEKTGVLFVVKSKTGRCIEGASSVPRVINGKVEKEVTSLPNTKYRITKLTPGALVNGVMSGLKVEMEEV